VIAAALGGLWWRARTRLAAFEHGDADRAADAAPSGRRGEAETLREMLDAIPVPVWRRDSDGLLADCNRAYAMALGVSREEALAERRELGLADPAGRREALGAPPSPLTEHGHLVIGGSRRLLKKHESPAACGGTVGFALDRTEVETAEAELWRHINAHAEMLEGIAVGVAVYGLDRRLKFFNAAFARLWGLEEGWLAAEPSLDRVLDRLRECRRLPEYEDFRAFKRERAELFNTLIEPQEEVLHLPDGRTLKLSIAPHPLGGLTFVYEDVSDRLALECSYNTLAQVQRATLDHLFEGVAVFGGDGRLKLYNAAYLTLWGLSETDVADEPHAAEIADKTRALIEDGEDWAATRAAFVARIIAQLPTSELLYRSDGSTLQAASVPLPDGNVLLTYLDVTDTARVERALRDRNEALETAARLKSEFVANVSHQLRTPLNTVIGFAEILTNQYFGHLNQRQLDYSRAVLDSAHQLLALIDDILDLASIDAGYMTLEKEQVDIAQMLHAVVSLTQERAKSRGLELSLDCPPGIGSVEADARRVKQALFNLISNALRFTPPGGAVRIAAKRSGAELLLQVADTGIGIADEDRLRIFDRAPRPHRESGAGLGLSLVKTLIELHGGSVGIESARGRGTRITCHLPTTPGVAGRRRRTQPSESPVHPASRRAERPPVAQFADEEAHIA
jgi:signal transduction histidine kinase